MQMQIVHLGREGRGMGKQPKKDRSPRKRLLWATGLTPSGELWVLESELSCPRGEGAGFLCTTSPGRCLRAAPGGINN